MTAPFSLSKKTSKMNCTLFVRQYDILSNRWGALQFLSSLIKIIPYFYCICFSFILSRIELTFCHSDHKVILRWGCFRRSTLNKGRK